MPTALPSLSQIPEETLSDTEESTSPRPLPQRSVTSLDSHRGAPNFSRPRTTPSSAVSSPTSEHPPNIGHFLQPLFRSQNAYTLANCAPIAPRIVDHHDYDNERGAAAPPPVVRTHADQRDLIRHLRTVNPHMWTHKPYTDSLVSDDSSITTDDTETETETNDSASIADSTMTDDSMAPSDFAFDGQMGWLPRQTMSQAERERQRWAAPVICSPADQRAAYDYFTQGGGWRPQAGSTSRDRKEKKYVDLNLGRGSSSRARPKLEAHESWLSDGSEDTTRSQGSRPGSRDQQAQRGYVDVFEEAANRRSGPPVQLSIPTAAPPLLSRSASTGTRHSGHSSKSDKSSSTPAGRGRLEHRRGHSYGSDGSRPNSDDAATTATSLSSGDWRSSEVDVSSLSPAKIAKLKKKGINPALYLEMKAAKSGAGGKRRLGVLTANSFLG
ncbi:hypothetical protein ANO11243_044050 [Dothideomycetidae sp. 11243]|nr:hypothetical protein ANO11243_044050 [fungal sp. No.11243]